MARILAIDYGTKRSGVAVTDPLQMIASNLTTVRSFDLLDFLQSYFVDNIVEKVIIGKPVTLQNIPSENQKHVVVFVNHFIKRFPSMPIEYVDERFTSSIAHQTVLESGISKKKRQNKELIDSISATIILQSYLENKR